MFKESGVNGMIGWGGTVASQVKDTWRMPVLNRMTLKYYIVVIFSGCLEISGWNVLVISWNFLVVSWNIWMECSGYLMKYMFVCLVIL